MSTRAHFPASVLRTLRTSASLKIRAGRAPHRFLGIWSVVVDDRVFIRSWNDKPTGWHRAWRADPAGAILVGAREIPVRAVSVRGARLLDQVGAAYQAKYWRPASLGWARGMDEPARRATTLELVPRSVSDTRGANAPGRRVTGGTGTGREKPKARSAHVARRRHAPKRGAAAGG